MQRILIWDVPTRLFHWTLALCFAGAWLTSESDQWLGVHVFLGYLMLALVGFRVIWGLVGTHYARFAAFWFGPKAALRYLSQVLAGQAERHLGHNPTGSVAIYGLLLLTLVIGVTGIFTLGGEEQQGVLKGVLSITQGRIFKKLHEGAALAMLLLVLGHIAGVLVESWLHHENLARSMLTGTKLAEATAPAVRAHWWLALLMLAAMLGFAAWWFVYAVPVPASGVPFVGPKLADNAQWRDECGSCHLPFHPSLLPARSWERLMREQQQHFGADLALDAATSAALLTFLRDHSADKHQTEAAFKIERSLAADAVPLRITETPYWRKKHREISAVQWKQPAVKAQSNCAACHQDAEAGTFEDGAMRLPAPSVAPAPAGLQRQ